MHTCARARPAVLLSFTLLTASGGALGGCEGGDVSSFERTITSTVTLSTERAFRIDVPVPVEVTGSPLRTSIFADLTFVVTASTATKARTLAEGINLVVVRPSPDEAVITVDGPLDVQIVGGLLKISAPPVLGVTIGSSGTVVVRGMERAIAASSAGSIKIQDAQQDVSATCRGGNILLDARLPQGTRLDASTGRGDIELRLVDRPSLDLEAAAAQGEIVIAHAAFPTPISATSYHATVNGGLATARVLTQAGRIVIRTR
ncbi:MAG: hypothetical protein IT384_10790 [Deltaproteobacteria bacterium]|nr:hypothetical protein [Deltaproteobacteria bacterium]